MSALARDLADAVRSTWWELSARWHAAQLEHHRARLRRRVEQAEAIQGRGAGAGSSR